MRHVTENREKSAIPGPTQIILPPKRSVQETSGRMPRPGRPVARKRSINPSVLNPDARSTADIPNISEDEDISGDEDASEAEDDSQQGKEVVESEDDNEREGNGKKNRTTKDRNRDRKW